MDYTNGSLPKGLRAGKYGVLDSKYTWMKGNLTASSNQKTTGHLVVGGLYTQTCRVV